MENNRDPADPKVAMMQISTALQRQVEAIVQQMGQARPPSAINPTRQQQGVPNHEDDFEEGQPQHRRRGPRNNEPEEVEDDFPRCNNMDMKLKAPTFVGRVNSKLYLEWEQRMEHLFVNYEYNQQKRLALVVAQLMDNAFS